MLTNYENLKFTCLELPKHYALLQFIGMRKYEVHSKNISVQSSCSCQVKREIKFKYGCKCAYTAQRYIT